MRMSGIDHVSVTVGDLDRSLAFYRDLLGIPMLGRGFEDGSPGANVTGLADVEFHYADLDLGSGQLLELLQYIRPVGVPVTQRVYDPGSGHIAIRVDDLDRMLGRLERAGITPRSAPIKLEDPEWWRGARCVYLTDPDGATIELVERPRRR